MSLIMFNIIGILTFLYVLKGDSLLGGNNLMYWLGVGLACSIMAIAYKYSVKLIKKTQDDAEITEIKAFKQSSL